MSQAINTVVSSLIPPDGASTIALVIFFLPLFSFVVLYFFGRYLPNKGDYFAAGIMGLCFLLSLFLFYDTLQGNTHLSRFSWFSMQTNTGNTAFTISLRLNIAAVTMLSIVTFISFLVHIYSIEYMEGKRNYLRYFPYLALFTFSMLGIVLSDNLLITFIFWELVGFSSYLLIGFWFEKDAAAKAAKNAFIYNRVGDVGFVTALLAIYTYAGTFELETLQQTLDFKGALPTWFLIAGIGLFLGSMGKSAQFPLQSWLPGAMEGPTPVSALLHAATMVAAGVYLLFKVHFLLAEEILTIIAYAGAITAFMGAYAAITQNDIKKVLAFSTISQLGYMMIGIGIGAFDAAFFHLATHAFFKACLFLAVGAVIHSMHHISKHLFDLGYYIKFDTLDMRLMGGFRKKMPVTFVTYTIAALSLIGMPFFSGFLSKDIILIRSFEWAAANHNLLSFFVPFCGFITVFITAFYMGRQLFMVFFNKFRLGEMHETAEAIFNNLKGAGNKFKIPLSILAFFSFWFIFSLSPFNPESGWLLSSLGSFAKTQEHLPHLIAPILSVNLALCGLLIAWFLYGKKAVSTGTGKLTETFWFRLSFNNFYLFSFHKTVFGDSAVVLGNFLNRVDIRFIDGILHGFAIFNVVLAHVAAWVDKTLIDGIVNTAAWVTGFLGQRTRAMHKGGIHGYLLFLSIFIIFLLMLILI